ncbi:vacuolar sorting-associated protein 32-like, partial [Trifolium pratense]
GRGSHTFRSAYKCVVYIQRAEKMIMLEGAKATTETVDALRTGASTMKAMQKATNFDNVDKTMDEINEQSENIKQIQEVLSAPIGASADFDEVIFSTVNFVFTLF